MTNSLDDTVSVIPAGSASVSTTVPTGDDPGRMVVRTDGTVVVVNRGGRSLTVIPAASAGPVSPAPAGGSAADAAAEPQGSPVKSDGGVPGPGLPVVAAGTAAVLLAGAATLVAVLRRRRVRNAAGGPASAWTFE